MILPVPGNSVVHSTLRCQIPGVKLQLLTCRKGIMFRGFQVIMQHHVQLVVVDRRLHETICQPFELLLDTLFPDSTIT